MKADKKNTNKKKPFIKIPDALNALITTPTGKVARSERDLFSCLISFIAAAQDEAFETTREYLGGRLNCKKDNITRLSNNLVKKGLLIKIQAVKYWKGRPLPNRLTFLLTDLAKTYLPEWGGTKKSDNCEIIDFANLPSSPITKVRLWEGGSPINAQDIYKKKNNNKKIDLDKLDLQKKSESESNFYKNSFSSFSDTETSVVTEELQKGANNGAPLTAQPSVVTSSSAESTKVTKGSLKDFYPLSKEDCIELQKRSGREFTLKAMNEILLDMSGRLERFFETKERFLNYMAKVFGGEERDAVKTSNETFVIKNNLEAMDDHFKAEREKTLEIKKQEAYLTELESRREVSPEMHLKKKLANVLERSKAYNLLTSYVDSRFEEEDFVITLNKHISLSQMDHQIILGQVKATQETANLATGEFKLVSELKIIMPKEDVVPSLQLADNKAEMVLLPGAPDDNREEGLWKRTRRKVCSFFGPKGAAVERHWLSKLDPEADEENKILILKAPTPFIRDFISQEYGIDLHNVLSKEGWGYQLV